MTGRLVDMAFTLGGKHRVTLELNGDFREIWDKLHLEPVLDVEIKKHREKRSHSANAYFHVLVNKIAPAASTHGKRTENGSTATWFIRTPAKWTQRSFRT